VSFFASIRVYSRLVLFPFGLGLLSPFRWAAFNSAFRIPRSAFPSPVLIFEIVQFREDSLTTKGHEEVV
jgi:hypothetical protein